MNITIPSIGIVLLIGPSNSGKSTLLQHWVNTGILSPSEIISSDTYRTLVSDSNYINFQGHSQEEAELLYEQYFAISTQAFAVMERVLEARCTLNKCTFVDATHLKSEERQQYILLGKKLHVPVCAIVLDIPLEELLQRDTMRKDPRGIKRIKQQARLLKSEKRLIKKESFLKTYFVKEIEALTLTRQESPLYLNVDAGLDIIGDIHGCYDELLELLKKLEYEVNNEGYFIHPQGRRFVSVGDIMSRGPKSIKTMEFFERHIERGLAFMTDSNHGWKIARWLDGRNVSLHHGDELVEAEFMDYENTYGGAQTAALKARLAKCLLAAPSHYVLMNKGLASAVVTHAGIRDRYIGKQSSRISDFCRYGDVQELNISGKPIRNDWFTEHQTSQLIIWGHDPKINPLKQNHTLNIDQGVVFGGQLTAFRYPEQTIISVNAYKNYAGTQNNPLLEAKAKRFEPPNIAAFLAGFAVETSYLGAIQIPGAQAKAAIDSVSHYTVPLEQLIYIPPTMSPTPQTSALDNTLEHPAEAFAYYKKHGVQTMIAEKKHMGSRAVVLLFKDEQVAKEYMDMEMFGILTTRTGRRFFDKEMEFKIVQQLHSELLGKNYFEKFNTNFVLLDAEILPWNLKAQQLIDQQYAHVAEQALMDRSKLVEKLQNTTQINVSEWLQDYQYLLNNAQQFSTIYQNYCWEVQDTSAIQIAPFHVLAHSAETYFHKPHTWHMEMNRLFAKNSDIFIETDYKIIHDEASEQEVIAWWEEMTAAGHEGIVIKPELFVTTYKGKLIQPAIKVRGREYLRIIYGMDYLQTSNLIKLKERNPSKKMRNALREFALGLEGIERFVRGESTARIHECVLGTLALESDPVDPRL
ncbi:polynucleotide kinase-phosphatase [Lysinibacillus pakistanensis]|uniref:Polynucleotide kinase-phosphatase n=1 Tax=Lysinibacillus pakistanensis TaxID=759811 RepID=A0AAX3WTS2_9BACI|nr:polynucleotide kinase-phosphatase [Lysinibacillus pakistanensis]MDM5234548.1 polynucleotide kinase-phosphatase [Lysinibacillus pakistanensis]WHY45125.1 polynucleotide kinase-phosphatase [Lysinibacillus pakistanensis]WHY50134.1 polynucleotide kinase-phosphatase [Lysinibacillus pakistanensis]